MRLCAAVLLGYVCGCVSYIFASACAFICVGVLSKDRGDVQPIFITYTLHASMFIKTRRADDGYSFVCYIERCDVFEPRACKCIYIRVYISRCAR